MAILFWSGPDGRVEHRLKRVTCIGRAPDSDIQIADASVSGSHARIICENNTWVLVDRKSTNGSFVNGERRERCVLHDGDEVRLGYFATTFRTSDSSEASGGPGGKPQISGAIAATRPLGLGESRTDFTTVFQDDPRISAVGTISSFSSVVGAPPEPKVDTSPRELARRLKASFEISQATAATLDLSQVLDRVLDALFEIFGVAERSFILLVDPATHEVNTAAVRRRGPQDSGQIRISQTVLKQSMQKREAMLCTDAMADQRYSGAQSVVALGIRSMMIAPLVFNDEVLGAIHVDTRSATAQFTLADLELLSGAAAQVAMRVANAQLHEKVVDSERLAAVGQTVAGLTHCIKNILQGIQGGAFILDKALRRGDVERVKAGWEMVKRNNAFMEELVFDLLSYSKQRPPEYAPTDLNALCNDICQLASARATANGVSVAFTPDARLGSVAVDPKGIRRCVLNLLMNGVDACAETGSSVAVRTHAPAEDGFARITVQDTGCGMSEETRAKLFTVFFSTKGSKGTGLGLPVTRKILEEHGGSIDAQSREGEGTTFTICLPENPVRKKEEGVRNGG